MTTIFFYNEPWISNFDLSFDGSEWVMFYTISPIIVRAFDADGDLVMEEEIPAGEELPVKCILSKVEIDSTIYHCATFDIWISDEFVTLSEFEHYPKLGFLGVYYV